MAYKPRTEREEIPILRSLKARMELSEEDIWNYFNLKKGFEGEVMFDLLTEKLQSECFILNDLLLELNNSKFQIDTLVVQDTIYLFDVKNHEGDYYYEKGDFISKSRKLMNNPLDQLKRCETLLRQLLQKYGFKLPVEAWVVFINPEFTLYQAPKHEQIIYPTQLNTLLKKLNMWTGKLNGNHKKLADLLVSMHLVESPYPRIPPYEYEELRKGIICSSCQSILPSVTGRKIVCGDCGCNEGVDAAVLRSVRELKLLFPDRKITTKGVKEWCGGIISKDVIRRNLNQNYKANGFGRWFYYE
ncbi:nuclease-related domain-containing protein [Neobacillus sp. WH10]|uniref:nuclease-related domain-containing protein n=1 Tax=Neobacillus sp. WH10 TaxID=3047873 RepID=UPI0024C15113|nr:nuclease-related domain-containing protein [Neobacillus sp. WH10]WHY78868.1 nuclease-related domain-containing protein [Neobacillus sp. WH10]